MKTSPEAWAVCGSAGGDDGGSKPGGVGQGQGRDRIMAEDLCVRPLLLRGATATAATATAATAPAASCLRCPSLPLPPPPLAPLPLPLPLPSRRWCLRSLEWSGSAGDCVCFRLRWPSRRACCAVDAALLLETSLAALLLRVTLDAV